jgi:5S rRNA maturation endonuclease (ribonuclease M5)
MADTAFDRLVAALDTRGLKIRRTTTGQVSAQCPAHEDRNPSLSLTAIEGQVLVYCHAACQTEDVVNALGLEMADLFDERGGANYTYTDQGGLTVLRTVHRRPDKQFPQSIHDKSVTPLYRLPNVAKAVEDRQWIYLVEGEKDVHALERLGVVATTGPGGARNWLNVDSTPLHDAQVAVIVDRDQAGDEWAISVRDSLEGKAAVLKFGRAKVGKDAADHVAAGLAIADFEPYEFVVQPVDRAAVFATDVEREAHKIRVRDAAKRKVRAETDKTPPPPVDLVDFLAEPDTDPTYRIDRLLPTGGRFVLAAQYKSGKTTLVANLIRCLVSGETFLGEYTTDPSTVAVLDFELDRRTLRRWLRDHDIAPVQGAVQIHALRGYASAFDIIDPAIRSEWVEQIRGFEIVIIDCLRPILDALALDENRDAGRFLVAFDEMLSEANVSEGGVVHHMGHSGERSRGDSRILDWPVVTWKLVRENPEEPNSTRFFSAFGRDVDQIESQLEFDPLSRSLILLGGSRKDAAADRLIEPLLNLLRANRDGLSQRQVETGMREAGYGRNEIRDVLARAKAVGATLTQIGPRNSIVHFVNPSAPVRHSAPPVRRRTEVSAPVCKPPPIGGGTLAHTHAAPTSEQSSAPGALCETCGGELHPLLLQAGKTHHVNCAPEEAS